MELKPWILYCAVLLARRGQTDPAIQECLSGNITVMEDTDVIFNCGSHSDEVEWLLAPSFYIGFCKGAQCYPSLHYPYSLQATSDGQNEYSSQLNISTVNRTQSLDLVCRDAQYNKTQSTCKLRVTVPGELVNGSCSVQLLRWYVLGGCRFTGMYDSDNNYTCVWRRHNDQFLTEVKDRESYSASNGRQYERGSCLYNQSIPIETGTYRYSVSPSTDPVDLFTSSINIMVPVQPSHDCPEIVPEGSDIKCTCRCSVIGNPPANIVWDRLNSQTLFLQNVRRENNSLVYTCRLTWGPDDVVNLTSSYVVRVAYKPSDVDIESTTQVTRKETDKPSDVDIQSTTQVTGKETDRPSDVDKDSTNQGKGNGTGTNQLHISVSSESRSGGVIGGVVAAVIVIMIIIAVIIVYIIKRRQDRPGPTLSEDECNALNIEEAQSVQDD